MKLYVLVRKDLSPSQQAVQAGHAVAEYLVKDNFAEWENGTLVYLGIKNLEELERWMLKLDSKNIKYTPFREPDIGDQVTAIAVCGHNNEFKKLSLI